MASMLINLLTHRGIRLLELGSDRNICLLSWLHAIKSEYDHQQYDIRPRAVNVVVTVFTFR